MRPTLAFVAAVALIGCKKDKCDPNDPEACKDGLVCEEVEGDEPHCFGPVTIEGEVHDLTDESAIEGARVVALDANNAPSTAVAITDADGAYALRVPTKRDEEGQPLRSDVTLRADADGYLTFPSGVRQPLPIDISASTEDDDGNWVLANASTTIGLIPVAEGAGTGIIAGSVERPADGQGVLVVAEIGGVGRTAIADVDGSYAIYNVEPGTHDVTAYALGVVYEAETASVSNDQTATVDLVLGGGEGGTVSGNVQIVNAPGGSSTSIILVVESTFDDLLIRGETPPGLRAGGVSGDYTIEGVPPGRFVVLGAFENDGLVRDPDTSIGGTAIQHIDVTEGATTTVEGFKITGALAVTSPGAQGPEAVTSAPTLAWEDDSSEDQYHVEVFDAYGDLAWEQTTDGYSGDDPAIPYAGPLEAGMYYQFRVTSLKDGVPISRTEDLKGVFWYDAP